jgi:MFS family permease
MHTFGSNPDRLKHPLIRSSFIFFVIIVFFYSVGDSIMSFMAPNIIDSIVKDPLLVGLIFAASSFVGFFVDYALSNLVKEKSFFLYAIVGMLIAVAFPIVLLLGQNVALALFSMVIWGVYFEMLIFSQSNYIHHFLKHDQHDLGWAVLSAFGGLAYIIGPTFALYILVRGENIPLYIAVACQLVGLIGLLVFRTIFHKQTVNPVIKETSHSLLKGFRVWKILNHKLYTVLFFFLLLNMASSTFWTIGAILAHSARQTTPIADMFYLIHLLPAFIVAPIGIKLSKKFGKKRTAYGAGILTGIALGGSMFLRTSLNSWSGLASAQHFFILPPRK